MEHFPGGLFKGKAIEYELGVDLPRGFAEQGLGGGVDEAVADPFLK